MIRRKRCPFCHYLVGVENEGIRKHIIEEHFPRYCSVCLKLSDHHKTSPSSPPYTMPCRHGVFIPGKPQR